MTVNRSLPPTISCGGIVSDHTFVHIEKLRINKQPDGLWLLSGDEYPLIVGSWEFLRQNAVDLIIACRKAIPCAN